MHQSATTLALLRVTASSAGQQTQARYSGLAESRGKRLATPQEHRKLKRRTRTNEGKEDDSEGDAEDESDDDDEGDEDKNEDEDENGDEDGDADDFEQGESDRNEHEDKGDGEDANEDDDEIGNSASLSLRRSTRDRIVPRNLMSRFT